ncbi:MAG: TldD/PmbA family protein [Lachnospiraceae bacterium]|nr:TldD/PmbA family protein [Lachnospiraceae bacterium]
MYQFPKDLYADVRIEECFECWMAVQNGEMVSDGIAEETGAFIRVFDGNMWYTSTTNDIEGIQAELDNLATLATPNPDILEHPMVKMLQVHQDTVLKFNGENCIKNVSRSQWKDLIDTYIEACVDESISEINAWVVYDNASYKKKSFYSSKGAAIVQDMQECILSANFGITVDGITTGAWKGICKSAFEDLKGHEAEVISERDRYLDFAHNAVQVEPGDYTCVLAPIVTAVFTHESFGHKSEADFMLNDKTLQEEWVLGKKVGNEKISICDRGNMPNHGYIAYDDEGTKAGETWLMKEGVLTGRLHDAKSAAALSEELTGNSRAQGYGCAPIVRMTNTFMAAGPDDPKQMIAEVKDGIYVYNVHGGTGNATFTLNPGIAYRIRDGKLCEPLRINVITGSVFQTLFDVDAVGTDYTIFDEGNCGKGGQTVNVADGGPTIRVKKLTVN